jgi:hypothetical protein
MRKWPVCGGDALFIEPDAPQIGRGQIDGALLAGHFRLSVLRI